MSRTRILAVSVCLALVMTVVGAADVEPPRSQLLPEGDCVVDVQLDDRGRPRLRSAVPAGPRAVLVIIMDFADSTVAGSMGLADPVSYVAGVMYENSSNTAGAIAEASFGLTTLESDADEDGSHDIYHITLPYGGVGEPCNYTTWSNDADNVLVGMGVDLGLYQHKMYVFPRVSGGCTSWAGRGQLGCFSVCRTWIRSETATVYAHEIGHNLGMHHASTDPDNDLTINAEYGDQSDIMGSSSAWRQFNGPHKTQMNWLAPGQVVDVFGGGPQQFTISALETEPGLALYPQVVRVSHPDRPARPYYLSYRVPVGYDATMSSIYRYRLQVHTATGNSSQTYYVEGLDDLETFEDPLAHDLVITQLSHDADTVTFEILRDEPDLDADGFGETVDCNDNNATVYPGAPELCDYVDNNCDEIIDEGHGACDIDGDGFDELVDCNDNNATIYPGAPELCDYVDNNCDTEIDEPDYDGDGVGNCADVCPDDPTKGGADGGSGTNGFAWCPCGVPEDVDSDGDGIPDCADGCPDDPDHGTDDFDGDGVTDCVDQCPIDPTKWNPLLFGQCDCGVSDEDSDGDFVLDCHDLCPGLDDIPDADIDGLPDCADSCPLDPWKFDPGVCGCDVADVDDDLDAVCDTTDNCGTVFNPSQSDSDADGRGHACDCGPGDPVNDAVLGPATGLRFDDPGHMTWDSPSASDGSALTFDVLRGEDAADFGVADCVVSDTATTSAEDLDAVSGIRFFLVRVRADCGEHLGLASGELRRSGADCP